MKTTLRKVRLLLAAMLTGAAATAAAQTDDEQILVYRNTGEINLLYTTEIDSIVCSRMDADSVMHDNVVSQIFYTADTALVVPVAEIDSVAFGSRNETVVKDGVRMMTAADSTWIIRYDGTNVYYRSDTPVDMLPHKGEKLFYGKMDNLFPIGLVAVVNSVTHDGGEYVVNVSDVELSDVFQRLFYAGRIETPDAQTATVGAGRRAPVDKNTKLTVDIKIGDVINVVGSDEFGIKGKVVANVLKGYFSMEADLSNCFELTMKAKSDDSDEIENERTIARLPLGVYALVFTPELKFDAFLNLEAELSANLRYQRIANVRVSYLREGWDKNPVMKVTPMNGEDNGTLSQIDLTCKGEVYAGVQGVLDFNILRETAGARLKLRLGPSFESEFGLGVLEKTEQYNPEFYGKAELNSSIKLQAKGTLYTRNIFEGDENEHTVITAEHKFLNQTLNLFPDFGHTRAVCVNEKGQALVTAATKSDNDILHGVETGFRIEDAQGEVIDSVFVDTITAGKTDVQGVSAEIDITGKVAPEARKTLLVRPVFRYAGHVVAARHAPLMSDMMLQPMVFGQTNGAVTYLSGMPFTGSAVNNETLYTAGPYLPVPVRDTVFTKPAPVDAGVFIDNTLAARLTGTWSGTEAGSAVTYVFKADGTGRMSGASAMTFSYALNSPQSGRISLHPDGDGGKVKVLAVANISETVLQYRIAGEANLYTLNRQ